MTASTIVKTKTIMLEQSERDRKETAKNFEIDHDAVGKRVNNKEGN